MGKGNIIGKPNEPTTSVASGVWNLVEQYFAKKDDKWPLGSVDSVEYLVVAGGGAGGYGTGGGGGAGGFLTGTLNVSSGVPLTVTVGAGGARVTNRGNPGSNSVFSTITSLGGGGGGTNLVSNYSGANGGSGGGASYLGSAGLGTSGQGSNGGIAGPWSVNYPCGGGGGADGIGATPASSSSNGGNGGIGIQSSISGSSVYYAGGGGGGVYLSGIGGIGGNGGGGNGGVSSTAGGNGTNNSGGGGGGSGGNQNLAGNGGSGIVIIRYLDSFPEATATTGSPAITLTGGYRVYTFTGSGSITF